MPTCSTKASKRNSRQTIASYLFFGLLSVLKGKQPKKKKNVTKKFTKTKQPSPRTEENVIRSANFKHYVFGLVFVLLYVSYF